MLPNPQEILKKSVIENFILCVLFFVVVLSSLHEGKVKELFFLKLKKKDNFTKADMKLIYVGWKYIILK